MIACPICRVSWAPDAAEPPCADPGHDHRRHEVHLHDDVVVLPDGGRIRAASFDPADPYPDSDRPDYGLYLDRHWQPPWAHDHVLWPDFGVPDDPAQVRDALRALLKHVDDGEVVQLGCLGGHGRTGTALAFAAVLLGEQPDAAVTWVRRVYCPAAIETAAQEDFVERFH